MLTLVAIVHVLLALSLIGVVLIQDPKDGAMGVFGGGGGSNTFFGSTGAANFLTKATRILAILFAGCCVTLAYLNSHKGGSVMDQVSTPTSAPATTAPTIPAVPATAAPNHPNAQAPVTEQPRTPEPAKK